MEINIRIKFRNEEFKKPINTIEKVSDLLSYLYIRLHFQEKNMTLKYGQMYLLNDKLFQSIGIKENDLIEVFVKKYPLTVTYKEDVKYVDANDEMTIKQYKSIVAKEFNKEVDDINLYFNNNFLMNESQTLKSLNLNETCSILIVPTQELEKYDTFYARIDPNRKKGKKYNIKVVYKDKQVDMIVDDEMPVYELKILVSREFNIKYTDITLKLDDHYLGNYMLLLQKYNIYERCTIYNEDYTLIIINMIQTSALKKSFTIKTRVSDLVYTLKEKISEKTGINAKFNLVYNGEDLENKYLLYKYNIPNMTEIQMTCNLFGGE